MLKYGERVCLFTGCYQWTIDDFLSKVFELDSRLYEMDNTMASPLFSFLDEKCRLVLEIDKGKNVVSLCLYCDFESTTCVHVRFGMNTGYKGKRENRSVQTDKSLFISVDVWMPYSEFIERRSEILSDGKLTVFCEMTRLDRGESPATLQDKPPREEEVQEESDSDDEATVSESKVVKKLQNDLKNLLESGEDCDVTIKVQGKEFPAHRSILRMRSPVFKSMFSHEMVEKLSGVVVIDDCDATTFPHLLNYLYTGSTQHMSDENVCQLYTASDKYQVEELKEECAAYMNHLSVSNFCDILTLALRQSDKDLIDLSTEFFCANATDVAKSVTWQTFLHENTTVGNELFLKSLSRLNKKYETSSV